MAVPFLKIGKKQRYLLLILPLLVVGLIIILWLGFFKEEEAVSSLEEMRYKRAVTINFKMLEDPSLKELLPFEEVSPFDKERGRTNPFLPY